MIRFKKLDYLRRPSSITNHFIYRQCGLFARVITNFLMNDDAKIQLVLSLYITPCYIFIFFGYIILLSEKDKHHSVYPI